MRSNLYTTFAVTIAFFACSAGVTGLMYGFLALGMTANLPGQVDNWLSQGLTIIALAGGAGLMVDGVRWAASLIWRNDSGNVLSSSRLR